jgi:hypothetical protein
MGIRYTRTHAALEGDIAVDDAEALAHWLRAQRRPAVALKAVGHVHSAVLQVLLALRPALRSEPTDRWLRAALGLPPVPPSEGEPA